jgi:hypothetical protein
MCDRQQRESNDTFPGRISSAQPQTDGGEETMRFEGHGQEREEYWGRTLHRLQECICELLIRNQELRMSLLDSTPARKSAETDL